ncbi:MAG: RHS repeat-associated core domain-containing protein [Pseudomonadota bacterium]
MANETATKSKRFYCVSLTPDICKTPIGPANPPIPYSVVGEFADATDVSPNVKSRSEPVILHQRSIIPTVKGDEPGTAGGIKSGTCGKRVETKTASKTYHGNGTATVQEGCEVWMNNRNTIGKIYERGGVAPRTRLQQINALIAEKAAEASAETREALKGAAKEYKDDISPSVHQFGAGAMDAGGKVMLGSGGLAAAGVAVGSTIIGAPVAAVMEVTAAAGGTVGAVVTAVGAATDAGATVLDHAADYVLTGKTPAPLTVVMNVGQGVAAGALGRYRGIADWLRKRLPKLGNPFKSKTPPGKKSIASPPPPRMPDKPKGGKTSKKKDKKSDKPSGCCPKNAAPGGKPVSSRHPVHFGTGEEVLYQTDVVLDGPIPLEWTRCYRSGSETEDWGLCGARWATPYTASLAVSGKGIVYIDDSGRAVRLPVLAVGVTIDNRKEGFALTRFSSSEFKLVWRDGSTETFVRDAAADVPLPHGYEGVNAMRSPGLPELAERYPLSRSEGRDGRGISIERFAHAKAGELLLRVRSDDGQVLEAMRDGMVHPSRFTGNRGPAIPPRIGRVEEVRADGTRICHVRYEYEVEVNDPVAPDDPLAGLPVRHNMTRQTDIAGESRTYAYKHHLLCKYTSYSGFAHTLEWISLAALRERWSGAELPDTVLSERFPVSATNSYQARAVATDTADGLDAVRIAYLDPDTTRVTDAIGGVLEYIFDANWMALDVRRVDAAGAVTSLGQRTWDRDGMLIAETDAAGRATRYQYDGAGNLTSSTDALGHINRIDYDSQNQPVSITDPLGHVTRLEYDGVGNLIKRTDALGHVTSYRYDTQGRMIELQDAKGGIKRIFYDSAGRLSSYTDCSGYITAYEYDEVGRLTAVVDALDQVTRYAYDRSGRLTAVTQADGSKEQFFYDADGRLLVHADAANSKTQYRYNGHGLPIERIDALGQTLQYRYDAILQLVELVNGNGDRYRLCYDAEGRLTSEVGFDGKVTNYSYDKGGQLVGTECAGRSTSLSRDMLGQLLAKQTDDGVHRYEYDALGRMTAVAAPHAEQRFTYDALGQLIEERSAYYLGGAVVGAAGESGADASFVMTHGYDELGNRIQSILPNGRRVDVLRYGSGHWHGTLWQGTTLVDIERDKLHRETLRRIDISGTVSARRQYDSQSRLSRMTLRSNSDTAEHALRERNFKYDIVGNLVEIAQVPRAPDVTESTLRYSYDPLGQLLKAVQPGLTETFAFDPAGNLLNVGQPLPDTDLVVAPPSPSAPIAPVAQNLLKSYQDTHYTYDSQGNVSIKHFERQSVPTLTRDLELSYDSENRLVSAVYTKYESRNVANYYYDAFGRRIAKQVTEEKWGPRGREPDREPYRSSMLTLFVWDGDMLAQELGKFIAVTYLYEPDGFVPLCRIESADGYDQEGNATSESHDKSVFTTNGLGYLTEIKQWKIRAASNEVDSKARANEGENRHILAWDACKTTAENKAEDDRIWHYNCDHLGTPRELVDRTGRLVWSAQFHAWGRMLPGEGVFRSSNSISGEVNQPLRFQGQYHDAETGLHYNRHRYYDPDSARYLTPDPIGLLGGANSYQYAPNPILWIDPRGLAKGRGGCDPCCGKNPTAEAQSWQGSGDYPGIDSYVNMVLKKGTILYSLAPGGKPGFSVTNHTLIKAGGDSKKFHELTQVVPGVDPATKLPRSLRTEVRVYRVNEDVCVAKGKALSQNPRTHGSGGATQYFVSPSEAGKLTPSMKTRKI